MLPWAFSSFLLRAHTKAVGSPRLLCDPKAARELGLHWRPRRDSAGGWLPKESADPPKRVTCPPKRARVADSPKGPDRSPTPRRDPTRRLPEGTRLMLRHLDSGESVRPRLDCKQPSRAPRKRDGGIAHLTG